MSNYRVGDQRNSKMRRLALAVFVGALALCCSIGNAATSSNASSPLGINLGGIAYYSGEIPFLNLFPNNTGWLTQAAGVWDTNEEKYLNLDSNGWPITLKAVGESGSQKFASVAVEVNTALPATPNGFYPAGQYVVTYQGQGTINYFWDAKLVSRSPGVDIIDVPSPTAAGILISIAVTDPSNTGNYIRNIQIVQAQYANSLAAGQIFNPVFLASLKNFRVLRFMNWLNINETKLSSWTNRPLPSNAFWGTINGVPIEIAVQLANAVSADPWLNIPVMADSNYVTQMATLVHRTLGSTQSVYIELSNEVWNGVYPQAAYAQSQGQALFPAGAGTPFDYNRNWYGMATAQMCDIWKSVWAADAGRVICVLAAQAANSYTATASLDCKMWTAGAPCSGHGIGAVAIAPYFGGSVPSSWTGQSDGGLGSLFASLYSQNDPSIPAGGWLKQASGWEASYVSALLPYKLPLIAYEGGQNFIGDTSPALTNLYITANLDPRMGNAYSTYMRDWRANGGGLFVQFNDVFNYSKYGEWGALQSVMETMSPMSSTPPKWQALQSFITGNSCWWAGCIEAIAKTPSAPSGVTVH